MIPIWLFLSIVIPLAVLTLVLIFLHFVENPLPFPDWGNAGFVMPDTRSRQTVINLLRDFGLSPDFRVDTEDVQRAIYRRKFPFILDVTSQVAGQRVGNPACFLAVVVANPAVSAKHAAEMLSQQGYESQAIHDPDPGLAKGKLSVVVSSQAFPSMMLVFRQHIIKMGGKPPAWKDD